MIECKDHVKQNIVMVCNEDGAFGGTGFFVQKDYCITCHHNVCNMSKIRVGREGKFYPAEFAEEYSDTEKDIAVLRVKGSPFEPLECAHRLLKGLEVVVWGYPKKFYASLPSGKSEYGFISDDEIEFAWPDESISGTNRWNKKPCTKVVCYQVNQIPGIGFSGAPVCYRKYPCVVGLYEAQDDRSGYVIPIEIVLDKFNQQKEISFSQATDIASVLDEGNIHFRKEEYQIAIQHYDRVLSDPNFAFACSNKAKSLGNMGRNEDALKCYDMALEINSGYAETWNGKGAILTNLARYEDAIESYDKAIEIEPNYAFAWNGKGLCLDYLGKYKEAIKCYNKALEINPNYADAWNGKGFVLQKLKEYKDATKCYHKALEINQENADAWTNRGFSLANLRSYEEAIKCYDKAIEINPKHNRAWNCKGFALSHLNNYEEAIKCYDKAIEINPKHNRAWNNKGKSFAKLRSYAEAIKCYDKAIEINPGYIYPWINKCYALNSLKRYDDAIECANKALELDPQYGNAWVGKGLSLDRLYRYWDAIECYNRALEIQPDFAHALYNRACSHVSLGNIENGLFDLKNALQKDGKKYSSLAQKAFCFRSLSNDKRFTELFAVSFQLE